MRKKMFQKVFSGIEKKNIQKRDPIDALKDVWFDAYRHG